MFKPGSQRGRTVSTNMILPITFKIDPSKTNPDGSPQGSIAIGELQMRKEQLQIDVQYTDGLWKGTVKDHEGNPMPGANIVVEGTNYGRVSDRDGTFTVEAKSSQNVTVSFMGYERVRLVDIDH